MIKKLIALSVLGLVVSAVTVVTTWRLYGQSPVRAMTYEQVESFLTQPGKPDQRTFHGIRGDGSTVKLEQVSAPDGRLVERRRVTDLKAYREVVVEGLTDSITTYDIPPAQAAQLATWPLQCTRDANPERSSMLGYDVVLVVQDSPEKPSRVESWVAPALGCLPLQAKRLAKEANGKLVLTNIRRVTSIRFGEPDAALFKIPESYTERAPSQVMVEYSRRYNKQMNVAGNHGAQSSDAVYWKSRPR